MYCTSCLSDIYWYLFVSPIYSIAVKYHKHLTFNNASVQQSQPQEQYLLSSLQTQNHIKHFKLIVNWVQWWRPSLHCWGWQMMRPQRRFLSREFCCFLQIFFLSFSVSALCFFWKGVKSTFYGKTAKWLNGGLKLRAKSNDMPWFFNTNKITK